MQLLAEHKTLGTLDMRMNSLLIRDVSSHNLEAKEKSSNSSLHMNPVASGDNVTTGLSSAHKIKEELPPLVPCCEGRDLKISGELVCSGLSAISVKHDGSVIQSQSMSCASEKVPFSSGLVKHRNSFRSLHRPDLKRVPYLRRMTPEELEYLFRGFAADMPTHSAPNDKHEQDDKVTIPSKNNTGIRQAKDKITNFRDDGNNSVLRTIPESRSGVEDVPAGMKLHGARARLYTSVLAGAKAGDQMDNASANEEYDAIIPEDVVLPEDEVQQNEELQIILPPRCDDVTNESLTNSGSTAC